MNKLFSSAKAYLPAADHDWLLPLYDPVVKLLGADIARRALLDQAKVQAGHRVLDIGCGTGTFAALIKKFHPDVDIVGLDPDPKALARAQRKSERSVIPIRFDQGFADDLPYPDASFDHVFSTFMFHHLLAEKRKKTLCEVRRVLAPERSFHLLDFTPEEVDRFGLLTRYFHSGEQLKDNSAERILRLMDEAGFVSCEKVREGTMLGGILRTAYYQGRGA